MKKKIQRQEDEWAQNLSPEQFEICRLKRTEPPFSGEYTGCKIEGIYECVGCGNPIFDSAKKYDSGSGWPSFWDLIDPEAIESSVDSSLGMRRVEVACAVCGCHLGHVFEDGPKPTELRYCINSISLALKARSKSI